MASRSLNKVLLIGNLTRDPELRYTPQGTAVCTFGLATNRTWTPADGGEPQEATEFHRLVAWAKLAEICSQILYKGRRVFIEGRLQTREWTDQEGKQRNVTEVVVDNMIALGLPKGGEMVGVENAVGGVGVASQPVVDEPSVKPKPSKSKPRKAQEEAVEAVDKKETKAEKEEVVNEDDIPF